MNDIRHFVFLWTLVSMTLPWPEPSVAQTAETGALTGTLSAVRHAALPEVNIHLTDEATGQTRTTVSQNDGRFAFLLLAPGTYHIEAEKKDFRPTTVLDIRINVAEITKVDVVMAIGSVTQSISVQAVPTLAQTESSTLGRAVNEEAVTNLPLVTRNYTQIIGLSPGVGAPVTNATDLGRGNGGLSPTQGTSGTFVHGARSFDNNYQINGISVNDNQATGNSSGGIPIPNADTIEEFKVQTGLYDAAFGHNAGASVGIITKGGSDQFHGTVFEFFRNEALNANDFFFNRTNQERPVLRQNQFGFTLGGPVRKDKLLFFTSYQGTRQLNGASEDVSTTCSASLFSPPLTNDRSAAALGALFAGQSGALGGVAIEADGSNINPVALALLQFKLPNGNFLVPTPQVVKSSMPFASQGFSTFSEPCAYNEDQFMTNLDYLPSPKSKFSGRFFFADSKESVSFPVGVFIPPGNVPGFPLGNIDHFRVFSLAHTYVFSSQLLNQVRVGFNRIFSNQAATSPYKFSDVGISEVPQSNDLPAITIEGSINMGPGYPIQFAQNSYSFEDSLSYVHGRNSMRFGGGITRLQNNISKLSLGGSLTFLSWPDFLLGMSAAENGSGFSNVFASVDGFGLFDRAWRAWEGNLYYEDDIKVASTFTLNAGLRYERLGFYDDIHGRNSSFDPELANPNPPFSGSIQGYVVASNFEGTVPSGVVRANNPYAVKGEGQNTWGPRLGFSWQVLPHTAKFLLRGGYGTYYSRPTGEAFLQGFVGAPFGTVRANVGTTNAAATFANPFPPAPSPFPYFPPYSPTTSLSVSDVAQDFRPAIVQQYSLNLQTIIARDFLLEVGYVGTRGTHLLRQRSLDQALSASPTDPIRGITSNTVANIPQREPFLGFPPDSLVQMESGGASWYNGLEVSLTKRFSHGLQFLGSYTYSKTLDTDAAQVNTTAGGNGITIGNQNNSDARYGLADYSRPQRFVLSYVYELPKPKITKGIVAYLLSGWATAGVLTIQSGQAVTILDTNANNVFGISEDRASIVPGCKASQLVTPGPVNNKLNDYFNAACFMTPAVIGADGIGTGFGNSGVGIVRGPAERNIDIAIIKSTTIAWPTEIANIEFRTEMFNAFNTPQFANPDNNFSSPTFGRISSTAVNPRIVQFALKLNF